jgi:hypothetical protein
MKKENTAVPTPEEIADLKAKLDVINFDYFREITTKLFQYELKEGRGINLMLTTPQVNALYGFDEHDLRTMKKIGLFNRTPPKGSPKAKWSMVELQNLFVNHRVLLPGRIPGY